MTARRAPKLGHESSPGVSYSAYYNNRIIGVKYDNKIYLFLSGKKWSKLSQLFVCLSSVTTNCGCIFHSPVAGFSLLVFEVS